MDVRLTSLSMAAIFCIFELFLQTLVHSVITKYNRQIFSFFNKYIKNNLVTFLSCCGTLYKNSRSKQNQNKKILDFPRPKNKIHYQITKNLVLPASSQFSKVLNFESILQKLDDQLLICKFLDQNFFLYIYTFGNLDIKFKPLRIIFF